MIQDKYKYVYLRTFIIILIAMNLIKLWGIFTVKLPWVSDEAGVWQVAQYFGGNGQSWITYAENSGRTTDYYGLITSLIYSPIINLFDNIILSYRCCLVLNIIMLSIIALVAFRMLYDWFGFAYISALICSISSVALSMVLFYANMIMTETVFTTWVWIVTYYFIFLLNNNSSTKHTLLFALLMILGYIIHSRCLIVWGIVLFSVILYRIIERRWIVKPIPFGAVACIAYIAFSKLSQNIQNFFWKGTVRNSTEHVASKVTLIFQIMHDNIEGICVRLLSLFSEFSIETCGFVVICSVISVQYLIYVFHKIKNKTWNSKDSRDLCCFIYVCGCFWAMNFCIAVNAVTSLRIKWFVYTRYATPFLGVYIMFIWYVLIKMKDKYNVSITIFFSILVEFLIFKWSILYWPQLLSDAQIGKLDAAWFFGYKIVAVVNLYGANVWICSIIICTISAVAIILHLLKRNKQTGISVVLTVYSLFIYSLSLKSYTTPGEFSNRYWEKIDGLAECSQMYDLHNYKIKYYGSANVYLPTQLLLGKYDLECVTNFSEIDSDYVIFFSDLISDKKISKWIIKLDEEEYIYTQNDSLKNQLSGRYEVIQ